MALGSVCDTTTFVFVRRFLFAKYHLFCRSKQCILCFWKCKELVFFLTVDKNNYAEKLSGVVVKLSWSVDPNSL